MKSLKTGILAISIVTILLAIGLIFGCTQQSIVNVDIQKDEGTGSIIIEEKNLGSISLTILNSNDSRTLYPTFITPTSYDISGDGPDTASFSFTNVTASTKDIINIVVGTWAITVKAKDSLGNIIASGSNNSVVVNKDVTTDATVNINYLQTPTTGTGIVDLTIDWTDSGVTIDEVELKIDSEATTDIYVSGTKANIFRDNLSSGSHTFIFKLKNNGVVFANVIESVHIYDNLTTTATITLTDADFKKAPTAPTSLTATEGLSKIVLSWTDTSYVETGFIVERSTTSGSGFVVIGDTLANPLAANTITYNDTTAVEGTTYYYKVSATNSFGSSTSTEASGKWQAPTVTLSNKPANPTNSTTAAITVGGTDVVAYKYKLDLGSYVSEVLIATDNTIDLTGLADGDHTIDVIGRDAVGNWQATPTSYTWEVNTSESIATLSGTPANPTNVTSIDITVGGIDIVTYKYKFDSDATSDETDIVTHIIKSSLAEGSHTLLVVGKTSVGNWQTTPTTYTWTVDTTAPTVTLSSTVTNPTKTSPIPITITFSESVSDFVVGDITVGNGTATLSGSGTTYTANITPSGQGAVTVDIAAGVATDAAGNTNEAATQLSRTYDSVAPTVEITSSETDPTKAGTIPITITFSESVTGLIADEINVVGGTKGALSGSGTTYTMDITVATSGTVTVNIAAGVATDAAGNTNTAATQFSIVVQFRGDINLTINLITPSQFNITWDGTGDLILSQGEILDVTADLSGATEWIWYLDGDVISGQTNKNIDIDTSTGNMDPGLHRLDVIVTKDSLKYSAYIKFEVQN